MQNWYFIIIRTLLHGFAIISFFLHFYNYLVRVLVQSLLGYRTQLKSWVHYPKEYLPDLGKRDICRRSIQYDGNWRSKAGSGKKGSHKLPSIRWFLGWHILRKSSGLFRSNSDKILDVVDIFPIFGQTPETKELWNVLLKSVWK